MGAPVFVADYALLVSAGGRFGFMPLHGAGAGLSPRRATHFLLLRQKKVSKEKATPLSASPALRYGATCGARGRGAPQNSLRALALRSDNCGESVHEARVSCGTRATPPSALLGAYRGDGVRTSIRAIASLGPVPRAQAPRADRVERSEDPSGCLAVRLPTPLLAAPAAGRLRGGTRVGARVLRDLTRRGCPSGAAQQQSEFHGAPRKRTAAGLPRSAAQGSQTGGRLLLPSFLGDARKEGAPPGAHPGTRPRHRHAERSVSHSQFLKKQPERLIVTPFTIKSVAVSAYLISARAIKHIKTQRPAP